jgi:hypothetical protein
MSYNPCKMTDVFKITFRKNSGETGTINLITPIMRSEARKIIDLINSSGDVVTHRTQGWVTNQDYI